MLGIGIGGTAEKAMVIAKESLMDHIDMTELKARGAARRIEELRVELYEKVNALGIGAQGLGGLSTVLDVKIMRLPDARRVEADRDHPELRGHAPRALHARRLGRRAARRADPRRLAERCTGSPTRNAASA